MTSQTKDMVKHAKLCIMAWSMKSVFIFDMEGVNIWYDEYQVCVDYNAGFDFEANANVNNQIYYVN